MPGLSTTVSGNSSTAESASFSSGIRPATEEQVLAGERRRTAVEEGKQRQAVHPVRGWGAVTSAMVGARSMLPASSLMWLSASMLGRRTSSGTLTVSSNRSYSATSSRSSPMLQPLSEANTT